MPAIRKMPKKNNANPKRGYVILAIKDDDPSVVYGYCPGYRRTEFPTSGWSRSRVWVMTADRSLLDDKWFIDAMKDARKSAVESLLSKPSSKGKFTMLRRICNMPGTKYKRSSGRTPNEYEWNGVRNVAARLDDGPMRKLGFHAACFRVNSRHCPVAVDFGERKAMSQGKMRYDKWSWMNPRFKVADAL